MTIDVRHIAMAAVAALVVWGIWYWLSRPDPDRLAIEARIAAFEDAVERGDTDAFMAGLTLDYADPYGHDREGITDRVFRITDRVETLDVLVDDVDIELDKEAGLATVKLRVELAGDGGHMDPDDPELRSHRRIRLYFRKEGRKQGDDWLVKRADVVYSLLGG